MRGDTVELPSVASVTLSPAAAPPPLWIGGGSPAALRRTARHGAGVRSAAIDELVSDLVRGYGIPPDDAAAIPIAGTPSQAAERFAAYADAGATTSCWARSATTGSASGS